MKALALTAGVWFNDSPSVCYNCLSLHRDCFLFKPHSIVVLCAPFLDYDDCLLIAYPALLLSFAVCSSSSIRAISKKIFQTL